MEKKKKNKVGRPSEGLETLPEGWYNDVLALYSEGGSDVEAWAMIYRWRGTFSNNLWERWMKEEPEFWETINAGKRLSEAWWQENGRTNLQNKDFNYTGWYMQMKNRFGWADSKKVDHTTNGKDIQQQERVVINFFDNDNDDEGADEDD